MAKTEKNLGFNTFVENQIVDFDQVNENFKMIDKMCICTDSNQITAGNTSWYCREFADKTVDMTTKIEYADKRCTNGSKAPYYTSDVVVQLPFTLTKIHGIFFDLSLAPKSDGNYIYGWVQNVTPKTSLSSVTFRIMAMESETEYINKQVSIHVIGVK